MSSPVDIKSYALALWLQAKGIEPLRATLDEKDQLVAFLFPEQARPFLESFYAAKDRLNALANKARHQK